MAVKTRIPQSLPGDEHLAVRLGMAVAYLWDHLPEETQRLLLDQAIRVETLPATVQLHEQHEQLKLFVQKHKDAD